MNVEEYLKRIRSENLKDVSLENLFELQKNHLANITFENIDIALNRPVTLDLEQTYQKVIVNKRGGFCYELNRLFAWLLKQLGYNFRIIQSKVFQQLSQEYMPFFSHISLMVDIDQKKYICDVGFGFPIPQPLEFILDVAQETRLGRFKFGQFEQDTYELFHSNTLSSDGNSPVWYRMYMVNLSLRPDEQDFDTPLKWVQSTDCRRCYNRTMCIRAVDEGIIMLVGYRFTQLTYVDGLLVSRQDREVDLAEIREKIKTEFAINLDCDSFEPNNLPLD